MTQPHPEKLETLKSLIEEFRNAMLITLSGEGTFHARPMAIASCEDPIMLWFITGADSAKVDELVHDGRAAVTLQSGQRFIALSGQAEVVRDAQKLRELWSPLADIWFEGGIEDPRAVLLRVVPEQAEYWDGSGIKGLRFAFEAAKAAVTGQTMDEERDSRRHGKVQI